MKEEFAVVVAEDETLLLNNIVKKINNSDTSFYVAAYAQTGAQALELVESHKPRLLVTDIRMPLMDGLELIRRVREHYPDMDIIITSGYSDFEYARSAIRYHVNEYLLKPVDEEELYQALHSLEESYREAEEIPPASANPAEQLKDYIDKNFAHDINLNELAEQTGYSPAHLTRLFVSEYNQTPSRYLSAIRLNQAKDLLANRHDLSIQQIGEYAGYPDQGYFSRVFKKQTGMSPLEYRKN